MSGGSIRFGMRSLSSRGSAKVSQGFSALGTSQKHGVLSLNNDFTFRGFEGQLVEGDHLTSGSENSFSGAVGHFKSTDCHLGHSQ